MDISQIKKVVVAGGGVWAARFNLCDRLSRLRVITWLRSEASLSALVQRLKAPQSVSEFTSRL